MLSIFPIEWAANIHDQAMNWKHTALTFGYFAFFFLSVFAIFWWGRRQRRTRAPFAKDLRLLRGPGETQLKILRGLEESFPLLLLITGLAPVFAVIVLLEVVRKLESWWVWIGLVVTVLVFGGLFYLSARWLANWFRILSNRYLGYFGERVAAEQLEPMKLQGWRIFHDVPCERGAEKFNIDHIAVGPGGVFAIETKTRRKGGAREGREDYKVFFDGEQLSWPWGEDRHGLDQTLGNAKWLKEWLNKVTAEKIEVTPVLNFPGWYVEANAAVSLRVINSSWLPSVLAGDGHIALSEKQIDLISRQLEQRCRDVQY